ncbi:MAG: LpqB family beta-propeller domain-containing protein [Angustibacter sp.]
MSDTAVRCRSDLSSARRTGQGGLAIAVAVVLGGLCGCAGLPDSGPAGVGRVVGAVDPEPLGVSPRGPRPGAGPAEVVRGFLLAGTGFADDHAVARTFLAESSSGASAQWVPTRRNVIHPNRSPTLTSVGSGSQRVVTVRAPVWGVVDATGELTLSPPGTVEQRRFVVTREADTWRIDRLPTNFGLWMAQYDFQRTYTPIRLTFVAPRTRTLVPELRWFPGSRDSLATAVVRSVLIGPPGYLARAVVTGAPPNTTLDVDAVPTSERTAKVDLSSLALQASVEQRRQLWAQMSSSLRQLPTVSEVELTVGGAPYPIDRSTSTPEDPEAGFQVGTRVAGPPLVLHDGRLLRLEQGGGRLVPGAGDRYQPEPATRGLRSIGAGPGSLVGVDDTGRRLRALVGGRQVLLVRGQDLTEPVVDASGWAWVADRAVAGSLWTAPAAAGGPARSLVPVWLDRRRVVSLDVSRDGTRVAVVSQDRAGVRRLDVSGVVRSPEGRPEALGPPRTVGQSLPGIRDVAWADRGTLAVLAGIDEVRAYQVEVGGVVTVLPRVRGPVRIRAGGESRELFVIDDRGRVLMRVGNTWRWVGNGSSVTVPT